MIPILYPANETAFTSNGLGRLSDVISCTVTEERNGQYELEMEYPVTGVHFDEIINTRVISAIPADGKAAQPFSIYKISKPINGIVTINAEHISYQLSMIPVDAFTATSCADALTALENNAAETCPFTFWTDKVTSGNFEVDAPASIRSLLGGTEGSILDVYGGGEYEFDGYDVKLHQNRGQNRGVILRYGKNITDIKQEENIATTYTGCMPYWKGTDSSSDTEILVTLPEKVLHVSNASNFPYQRTIALDLSSDFEGEPTEAQLRTRATAYMTANNFGVPKVSIDVSFVALWQTEEYKDIANLERVNLCDTVTVYFTKLGINATAKVVKTVYNVLLDRYDSIELGESRANLAKQMGEISAGIDAMTEQIERQKTFMAKAVDRATKLITGGLGGYVVFNMNADGEPQEILIMDSDDIQSAVNVIRMNKNGIGFSTTGYSGPFTSAWTIDGHFNADFITSGHINANIIQGGTFNVGGQNNGNGVLKVYDASGNLIGTLNNQGAEFLQGAIVLVGDTNKAKMGIVPNITYLTVEQQLRVTKNTVGFLINAKTPTNGSNYLGFAPGKQIRLINLEGSSEYPLINSLYYHEEAYVRDGNTYIMHRKRYGNNVFTHRIHKVSVSSNLDFWSDTASSASITSSSGNIYFLYGTDGIALADIDQNASSAYTINTIGLTLNQISVGFILTDDILIFKVGSNTLSFEGGHLKINGNVVSSSSTKRYKHDIEELKDKDLDPHRLLDLPIKQFIYNDDAPLQYRDTKGKTLPGFIAEEVDEIYPSAVIHDTEGKIESWDERRIIPGMLSLIQEQHETIQKQEEKIQSLEERIEKLEKLILGGKSWQ